MNQSTGEGTPSTLCRTRESNSNNLHERQIAVSASQSGKGFASCWQCGMPSDRSERVCPECYQLKDLDEYIDAMEYARELEKERR